MPPSFGVKYPFAPKLFPNYNYFLQAVTSKALHAVAFINSVFRLLRWGHLINTSGYLLQPLVLWPFPPALKNSSAPPSAGGSSPNTQGSSQGLQMASISEIPQVCQSYISLLCHYFNLQFATIFDFFPFPPLFLGP